MLLYKLLMLIVGPLLRRNGFSEEEIDRTCRRTASVKERLYGFFWEMAHDPISRRQEAHYNAVMSFFNAMTLFDRNHVQFGSELDFLQKTPGVIHVFPYARVRKGVNAIKSGRGETNCLPFVCHGDKRLYFPKAWSVGQAEGMYRYFVETEGILGSGCLEKSPHSYVTETFKVESGDVVLDVGCSEGLFALDNVDIAGKVYLFETQKCWKIANDATFAPFGDKVIVHNRFVGAKTDGKVIALEDAVKDEPVGSTYFIKMDIEGGERTVLASSAEFLRKHRVKLACATYHRQDDEAFLTAQLKEMGFSVLYSDGHMLPDMNGFVFPFFRRGVIYAKNY